MILVHYLIFFLVIKYILVVRIPTVQKCVKYTFHLKSHRKQPSDTTRVAAGGVGAHFFYVHGNVFKLGTFFTYPSATCFFHSTFLF